MSAEERGEAFLQLAALSTGWLFGDALQGGAEVPRPSFGWVAIEQVPKRQAVPEVQVFGLLDHGDRSSTEAVDETSKIVLWTEVAGIPSFSVRSSAGTWEGGLLLGFVEG